MSDARMIVSRLRCAVYTRKSSDEGLDQEYNSLESQRDAGHAYIASQRHEGWIPVADDYDDGGFSGGTMERPALQRLMADIERGLIDIVVVYKIDRLTRSLTDFSKMIDVFERRNVSFVAVTQQFNTTTSMGRLMLNILLSFAQFEREVTGERIRDKIAASKRKGMWMGGIPPLGYDVKDRRLIVNDPEAKLIRHIFERFLQTGSTTVMVKELALDGYRTKSWTTQDGKYREGKPIDKTFLYKVLHNRTYLGEITHKGQSYTGAHEAIIPQALWDKAHSILAINHRTRAQNTRARTPALLKGLLFTADGYALTPTHTRRHGKLYRYYVSTRDAKMGYGTSAIRSLPADTLETTVVRQLRSLLTTPDLIVQTWRQAQRENNAITETTVAGAMEQLEKLWDQLFPVEQARIVRLLVERVVVSSEAVHVHLRGEGIARVTDELQPAVANVEEVVVA